MNSLLRSTVFRLAVLFSLTFALSASVLLGFFWWNANRYLTQQNDAVIAAEIEGLTEHYEDSGLSGLLDAITERSSHPANDAVYLVTDRQLAVLAGNLALWPDVSAEHGGLVEFNYTIGDGESVAARAKIFTLGNGFHLLVGRDADALMQTRALLAETLVWALLGALVFGISGGYFLARSVARRIESINDTARRIQAGTLAERISRDGSGDEFDRLADNLNAMLARIESLVEGVRHVGDALAHDMRMPLTRLRNRLDGLAQRLRHDPALAPEVYACLNETDSTLATFNALLRIARIEAGGHGPLKDRVDLATIASDAIELYQALADDRGITLSAELASAPLSADRDLIFQLIVNLLDNAIKFSQAGGAIALRSATTPQGVELSVSDNGPGVPASEHASIFDRFYRSDSSRAAPGSGLGLALVKAVADLHDAAIVLEDNAPGLRVRVLFPPVTSKWTVRAPTG